MIRKIFAPEILITEERIKYWPATYWATKETHISKNLWIGSFWFFAWCWATINTQKWQAQNFEKNFSPSAGGRNAPIGSKKAHFGIKLWNDSLDFFYFWNSLFSKMPLFVWQEVKDQFFGPFWAWFFFDFAWCYLTISYRIWLYLLDFIF